MTSYVSVSHLRVVEDEAPGLIQAFRQRYVGFGHGAGPDEGAQLDVGERLHQCRFHTWSFDARETGRCGSRRRR